MKVNQVMALFVSGQEPYSWNN